MGCYGYGYGIWVIGPKLWCRWPAYAEATAGETLTAFLLFTFPFFKKIIHDFIEFIPMFFQCGMS